MVQISSTRFTVTKGEIVTIEVDALGTAVMCAAAVDGTELNPVTESPRTYQFKITKSTGKVTHFAFAGIFSPSPPPEGAAYSLFAQGDRGGNQFTGPQLSPANQASQVDMRFTVK